MHCDPRTTAEYRLAPGLAIPWENFRDIERGLCECLAAPDLPMRRRLHVASRLLGALRSGAPIDAAAWTAEPRPAITAELRTAIREMLARILKWDRRVLRELPGIPAELFSLELAEPQAMSGVLRNALFSKVYSYPYDLTTALNFLIVLYLIALSLQAAAAGPLAESMWRELGSLGVHGLLRDVLHEGIPEGFRGLFGTAEFGQWMLAA